MTRVVHIINQLGWGGAENLVRGMARHLRDRGWRVTVCALGRPVCDADDLDARCLDARGPFDLPGYVRLCRLLGRLRPDLIHLHLLWAELWGLLAARHLGVPAVITGHCTYDARADSYLARRSSRALVRAAAATICISRSVARYRVQSCGDSPPRLRVIHNGIEVDKYCPDGLREEARARFALPRHGVVIGTVARLHPVKGIDTFLGAAALLARRRQEVRFLVAGGGPQEEGLRRLASSLGLHGRVTFTGEVAGAEVPKALAAMDVFVAPSLREGLGIAAIEAMAAGLPVAASDCEGLAEVVEDGRSGLLFAPGDARALAGKLDLLLRQPELARRLSVGARERARSAFSLDGMVTKVEAVYREAMSGQVCESDVAQLVPSLSQEPPRSTGSEPALPALSAAEGSKTKGQASAVSRCGTSSAEDAVASHPERTPARLQP